MKEQEIIPGTPVRYWSVIDTVGNKYNPTDTTITSAVWHIGAGHPVCSVEGISGCVSISHLEKL
jgi:hypothetical protein